MHIFLAIMIFTAIACLTISSIESHKSRELTEEELEEIIKILKEAVEERKKEEIE